MGFLGLVGVLIALLLLWFLFLVFIDNFGSAILAMVLLFKWTVSAIIELIRYVFRPKDKDSPA